MWQIAAAFSLAGGLRSAKEYRKAGAAALADARAQAAEIRKQKQDVAMIASQQHENRMEQFAELVATNEAYAAYMGRTGRSIQALQKAEQRKYGRDVDRIRGQEAGEKDRLDREASSTVARGEASNKSYRSAARGSVFNAVSSAAMLSIPSSSKAKTKTSTSPTSKSTLFNYQSPKLGTEYKENF